MLLSITVERPAFLSSSSCCPENTRSTPSDSRSIRRRHPCRGPSSTYGPQSCKPSSSRGLCHHRLIRLIRDQTNKAKHRQADRQGRGRGSPGISWIECVRARLLYCCTPPVVCGKHSHQTTVVLLYTAVVVTSRRASLIAGRVKLSTVVAKVAIDSVW